MVFTLDRTHSIAHEFLGQLRDIKAQTDRMRFRKNLKRLGTVLAYELSKTLSYEAKEVRTPLDIMNTYGLSAQPVLIPVLRAALPFYDGFLDIFDAADSGFIGAYRSNAGSADEISIDMEYVACGPLEGKEIVLIDPMLATGKSIVDSVTALSTYGQPKHIHFVSAIAAPEGIAYIQEKVEAQHSIWTGAIDERLNDKAYIVPGLGDAGDLCFGEKI